MTESRLENARIAELSCLHELDGLQGRLLEMQTVSDHQLDAGGFAALGDGLAIRDAGSQRLLAEHVRAGGRDAQRVGFMQ